MWFDEASDRPAVTFQGLSFERSTEMQSLQQCLEVSISDLQRKLEIAVNLRQVGTEIETTDRLLRDNVDARRQLSSRAVTLRAQRETLQKQLGLFVQRYVYDAVESLTGNADQDWDH
jgi:hypothetical protein